MVFLVAITVVAEIADIAGVFDVAGHWAARPGDTAPSSCGCCWSPSLSGARSCSSRHDRGAADTGRARRRPPARTLARPLCADNGLAGQHRLTAAARVQPDQPAGAAPLLTCWASATPATSAAALAGAGLGRGTLVVLAVLHRKEPARPLRARRPARAARPVPAPRQRAVCVRGARPLRSSAGLNPAILATAAAAVLLGLVCSGTAQLIGRCAVRSRGGWSSASRVLFVVVDIAGRHGLQDALRPRSPAPAPGRPDLLRLSGPRRGSRERGQQPAGVPGPRAVAQTYPGPAHGTARRRQRRPAGDTVGLAGHPSVGAALPQGRGQHPRPGHWRSGTPVRASSRPRWPCCRCSSDRHRTPPVRCGERSISVGQGLQGRGEVLDEVRGRPPARPRCAACRR